MATSRRRVTQNGRGEAFSLAEEVRTFEARLPKWADREGQFVLIKGRDVRGFYSHRDEALQAGYDQFGGASFLVKQILPHEPVYQLGHVEL